MTKINIISGFLGAGKTTLIQKLLKEAFSGEKLVLIENEFGEIGIDGGFLKDAGVEITEMNSGCICCSLVGDFGTALKQVLVKFNPDRILIEPSGVGKLSDVLKAVQGVGKEIEIELDNSVTVADATKCKMYIKNFGEFFNNQLEYASTIILSRTQKLQQDKLEACVKLIREHNGNATIITTPWEQLSGSKILEAMQGQSTKSLADELMKEEEICSSCGHHHNHGEECYHDEHHHHEHEEHHHHGHEGHHHDEHEGHHQHEHGEHHHADEVFTSWGIETPRQYTKDELKNALEELEKSEKYGTILRAKGILPSTDENWIYFDFVPGEIQLREGSADYTGRLCVIGANLNIASLEKLFYL